MIKKFHIHIYRPISMYEIDIEAETDVEAKEKAIKFVRNNNIHAKKLILTVVY
jgi:hypothetical protein